MAQKVVVLDERGKVICRGETGKVIDEFYVQVDGEGPYAITNTYLIEHEAAAVANLVRMHIEERALRDAHTKQRMDMLAKYSWHRNRED